MVLDTYLFDCVLHFTNNLLRFKDENDTLILLYNSKNILQYQ